jgi:hypothetical protein
LKQYRNGLRLTESGLKAVKLLLVMDTNSRWFNELDNRYFSF